MSETILVVDDEENIRHTLRGVLADEGYDVLEAPDGRRALELLEHVAPRLAIVDVWMPEVDGVELVERMRTQSPGVPIIVISGHGTIETAVRVIRLGAFDFLEKPFPLDALLNVVGRALGTNADATATAAAAAALSGGATTLAPARARDSSCSRCRPGAASFSAASSPARPCRRSSTTSTRPATRPRSCAAA